jgi:hypothetical protein
MEIDNSSITTLRTKYLEQAKAKEAELAELRVKIAVLDELSVEAGELSSVKNRDSAHGRPAGSPKLDAKLNQAVLRSGLTNSVLIAITQDSSRLFSPPQMRDYLLANGFKPGGKNFGVSVGTTLKRLADQGRIMRETLNGKPVFKAKT